MRLVHDVCFHCVDSVADIYRVSSTRGWVGVWPLSSDCNSLLPGACEAIVSF